MGAPLYLITGAGGGTGGVSRQVIERLRERGDRVRALVQRDDARAEPLRALGAEVVVGVDHDHQPVRTDARAPGLLEFSVISAR
ncbi:hypothetical protein ACFYXQ_46195 [Nocardia jiangxiensis]|uniref:Uncharacterized protein n=1 Tax=Nocardia jiangxiensis TaxID=282685 RepID=A0ABW6SFT1_9NOCA